MENCTKIVLALLLILKRICFSRENYYYRLVWQVLHKEPNLTKPNHKPLSSVQCYPWSTQSSSSFLLQLNEGYWVRLIVHPVQEPTVQQIFYVQVFLQPAHRKTLTQTEANLSTSSEEDFEGEQVYIPHSELAHLSQRKFPW